MSVTEGLPSHIFTREAHLAYTLCTFRLVEIYVPFVRHTAGDVTDAWNLDRSRGPPQ